VSLEFRIYVFIENCYLVVSGDLATPWRIAALAGMEASHEITAYV
jgi:hypothetical protein